MTAARTVGDVTVRFALRKDVQKIATIDLATHPDPWTLDELREHGRDTTCILKVAEVAGEVFGFMCYQLGANKLTLLRLGVCPLHMRQGVGTALVERLTWKLEDDNFPDRDAIEVYVPEDSVGAQLFFKSQGFRCTETIKEHCERDVYRFVYWDWA